MCIHFLFYTFRDCSHSEPIPQEGKHFVSAQKCNPVRAAIDYYHTQPDRPLEIWPYPYPQTCPPVWGSVSCVGNVAGLLNPAQNKCSNCIRLDYLVTLAKDFRDLLCCDSDYESTNAGTPDCRLSFTDYVAAVASSNQAQSPKFDPLNTRHGSESSEVEGKVGQGLPRNGCYSSGCNGSATISIITSPDTIKVLKAEMITSLEEDPCAFTDKSLERLMRMIYEPGWFWDISSRCCLWFVNGLIEVYGEALIVSELRTAERFLRCAQPHNQDEIACKDDTLQEQSQISWSMSNSLSTLRSRSEDDSTLDTQAFPHHSAKPDEALGYDSKNGAEKDRVEMFPSKPSTKSRFPQPSGSSLFVRSEDGVSDVVMRRSQSACGRLERASLDVIHDQRLMSGDSRKPSLIVEAASRLEIEVRQIIESDEEQWRTPNTADSGGSRSRRVPSSRALMSDNSPIYGPYLIASAAIVRSDPGYDDIGSTPTSAELPKELSSIISSSGRLKSRGRIPAPKYSKGKRNRKSSSLRTAVSSQVQTGPTSLARGTMYTESCGAHTGGHTRPVYSEFPYMPPTRHNDARINTNNVGMAWQHHVATEYERPNLCGACGGRLNPNPPIPSA